MPKKCTSTLSDLWEALNALAWLASLAKWATSASAAWPFMAKPTRWRAPCSMRLECAPRLKPKR
eukprot:15452387-Alexandrium_andersonii.AAC.1